MKGNTYGIRVWVATIQIAQEVHHTPGVEEAHWVPHAKILVVETKTSGAGHSSHFCEDNMPECSVCGDEGDDHPLDHLKVDGKESCFCRRCAAEMRKECLPEVLHANAFAAKEVVVTFYLQRPTPDCIPLPTMLVELVADYCEPPEEIWNVRTMGRLDMLESRSRLWRSRAASVVCGDGKLLGPCGVSDFWEDFQKLLRKLARGRSYSWFRVPTFDPRPHLRRKIKRLEERLACKRRKIKRLEEQLACKRRKLEASEQLGSEEEVS